MVEGRLLAHWRLSLHKCLGLIVAFLAQIDALTLKLLWIAHSLPPSFSFIDSERGVCFVISYHVAWRELLCDSLPSPLYFLSIGPLPSTQKVSLFQPACASPETSIKISTHPLLVYGCTYVQITHSACNFAWNIAWNNAVSIPTYYLKLGTHPRLQCVHDAPIWKPMQDVYNLFNW